MAIILLSGHKRYYCCGSINKNQWAVKLSWQHSYVFKVTYKPNKLGQADLFLVCDQSLSVGLCLQDHKSLRVALVICATLVNTKTH